MRFPPRGTTPEPTVAGSGADEGRQREGIAIENARLHQRVRELDLVEDRERIARDLHDTGIQRLFATGRAIQAAAGLAATPTSPSASRAPSTTSTRP